LLGRRLTQYSVGASRRETEMITFVAVKRRPLPEDCAVGTYVELRPDDAVASLARRALESLDYQGIAEVEILRDEGTGRDYLIEINARPWIQYGLGPASGHDLLAFQLDPRRFDRTRAVTRGKRWLNFPNDLFYCFSRSVGVVRRGRVPVASYLRSMLGANTFAHFAWTDPLPAWRSLTALARRGAAAEDPPHAN
jgi:predicted ATP-grasp superfamily ATP-dependent carboligase